MQSETGGVKEQTLLDLSQQVRSEADDLLNLIVSNFKRTQPNKDSLIEGVSPTLSLIIDISENLLNARTLIKQTKDVLQVDIINKLA